MYINFIFDWSTSPQNDWSGTPYSLQRALQEYVDIKNIVLSYSNTDRIKLLISRCLNKITRRDNFDILRTNIFKKYLNNLIKKNMINDVPSICFLELKSDFVENFYVYQDLSVDFLVNAKKNKVNFLKFTPLSPHVSDKIIEQREKNTLEFYKRCAGIFTMSKWLAEDLILNTGIPSSKVYPVGGGCNIDISKVNITAKKGNKFLFIGKDFERKGGHLVVRAFQKLIHNFTVELYIIGPDSIPGEYLNINGLYFLGRKNYSELIEFYNVCDYFVMPSQFEAYGLVFTEALIFGLPCIGNNCYAMPEFIKDGDNGYLLYDYNVNELYILMKKILQNKEMVKRVQMRKEEYIEKYSWDTVAKRMIGVIKTDNHIE